LIHVLQDKSIATALVFTRTKHGADKVQRFLTKAHIKAEAIHGNKSQNARQNALRNFKDRTTRVLVATDIAARGIDIDDLNLVINYEIPNIPETYVHRIGRTGRAGLNGKAVSFCDAEEREFLRDIQKLISIRIPVVNDHPFLAVNIPVEGAPKKKKPAPHARPVNPNKRPQATKKDVVREPRVESNGKKIELSPRKTENAPKRPEATPRRKEATTIEPPKKPQSAMSRFWGKNKTTR